MRILFTVNPGTTVFNSMVPLAWALRTAGHDVCVASQPLFANEIVQAGLTAVPLGRDLGLPRLLRAMGVTTESLEAHRVGLPEPYDVVTGSDPSVSEMQRAYAEIVEAAKYETFAIMTELAEFALHWQPELVVWEPLTPAGAIVAKACGAAHARLLYGIDVFGLARERFLQLLTQQPEGSRYDPLADWLSGYARKYGGEFTEDLTTGHFTIDQLPRSLQIESSLHYLRGSNTSYGGPAVVPPWLQVPPQRPRVALSMGLSATEYFAGYTVSVQELLESLADLNIELIATVAESEQPKLSSVPDNARIVSHVPLYALAPTCSVAITHAGFGTLTAFTPHGVPQLTLPFHFDEPLLGDRLAGLDAGLNINPAQASGRAVRDGVVRLLNESRFHYGAKQLSTEIHSLPNLNELVEEIELLTVKYRSS